MNRRSFIKTAAAGVIGMATGLSFIGAESHKIMPGHVINHMRQRQGTVTFTGLTNGMSYEIFCTPDHAFIGEGAADLKKILGVEFVVDDRI